MTIKNDKRSWICTTTKRSCNDDFKPLLKMILNRLFKLTSLKIKTFDDGSIKNFLKNGTWFLAKKLRTILEGYAKKRFILKKIKNKYFTNTKKASDQIRL